MSRVVIKVFFPGGKALTTTTEFQPLVKRILHEEPFNQMEPIKILFSATGKVLYFDKALFHAYERNELEYADLIERCSCDELYRNTFEVSMGNEVVDPGSLWKAKGNQLVLVDEDRTVNVYLNRKQFEVAT